MYTVTSLEIAGYRGEPVPNSFIRQDAEAEHLAILFPGIRYTVDMPLLYYPGRLLSGRGADVLRVQYAYGWRDDFAAAPEAERERWMVADAQAAAETALAARAYGRITLAGKSIGTLAMGHLLAAGPQLAQARCIWLTPLLQYEGLRAQIKRGRQPSLFVIGTADHGYDPVTLSEVVEATKGESVVVEGADHSLELPGSIPRSLDALKQVVQAVEAFLG